MVSMPRRAVQSNDYGVKGSMISQREQPLLCTTTVLGEGAPDANTGPSVPVIQDTVLATWQGCNAPVVGASTDAKTTGVMRMLW